MKYSSSKENYIKAIFHLQRSSENVSTNALANALQTKPASVTDMLKKLKEQKILQYERYKGVRLTAEGKKIALLIVRKHRLWEYFLVEKLQFGWEEVHEIAEELEHISSKKLIDRLDDFLGNPRKDPHGDPIPDANGKMPVLQQISLDAIELNKPMEITGIGNQTPELMELLQRTNIKIGSKLEVKKKFSFDNSLEIKMRNAQPFIISQFLAKNLLVNDEE